jgi:DNA-binding SARP family transcriptional activator
MSWGFAIDTDDLVEFSSDPAFSVDDDLRVIGWNTAAAELLGYSAAEVLGKKCGQVLQALYPTGEPLCSALCEGRSCIALGEKWGMSACRIRREGGEMVDAAISTLVLPQEARKVSESDTVALIFLRKLNSAADSDEPDLPMRVFTLGRFSLALAGHGLDVGSWRRKQSAVVLKCLVSQLGRPVHRERLIEWLWPNSDPERSWQRLKVAISFLRGVLRKGGAPSNCIETIGQSYLLRSDAVWIDSEEFCTLVAAGRKMLDDGNWSEAQKRFEEAESLYRGDYFEDEPYAEWCAQERERLHEIHLELLGGMARCYAESGDFAEAAQICRTAIVKDPCRESFIRALLTNLVALDRPASAKMQFLEWRQHLDENFGLQPTGETLRVYERLLEGGNNSAGQSTPLPAAHKTAI